MSGDTSPSVFTAGWQEFSKLSQLSGVTPGLPFVFGPSTAMVFVDEKDNSINGPVFAVSEQLDNILNVPAAYHDNAGGVGFADGHVELHKWLTATVLQPPAPSGLVIWGGSLQRDGDKPTTSWVDVGWMLTHSSFTTYPQDGLVPY